MGNMTEKRLLNFCRKIPLSSCNPTSLARSCVAGYENLVVWSDLLDHINVFPVADGDTGANLRVSLAPLRDCPADVRESVERLATTGVGNSGNIAVAFLREFLGRDGTGLTLQAEKGRDAAYQAIHTPIPGTMLDVFDELCLILKEGDHEHYVFTEIRTHLQQSVLKTATRLAELKDAGVVDSGALGMFVFFDGFFQQLLEEEVTLTPVVELFGGRLQIASSFHPQDTNEYCVDAVLATDSQNSKLATQIAALGTSAVVVPGDHETKIHLHTRNPELLRDELSTLGDVVNWSDEAIDPLQHQQDENAFSKNRIRVMSDSAASIPRSLGREYGIILLDSYILAGDHALPESLYSPEKLYSLMRKEQKVSTAQASNSERHLHYQASNMQYGKILYLSTGSAFTGNYSTATAWQKQTEATEEFYIIDSGAASGRLAVMALLTARLAATGAEAAEVIACAKMLSEQAQEYVFIDELKYLLAGGRVSKTKAFFADLLHMKPVISPCFEGVQKKGMVRSRKSQLTFALEKLTPYKKEFEKLFVLLQYTDNKDWLSTIVEPEIRHLLPCAEILLLPLSLTSGVHMGPGTWSIAYAES